MGCGEHREVTQRLLPLRLRTEAQHQRQRTVMSCGCPLSLFNIRLERSSRERERDQAGHVAANREVGFTIRASVMAALEFFLFKYSTTFHSSGEKKTNGLKTTSADIHALKLKNLGC